MRKTINLSISVIIPAYNAETTIARALTSVQYQTVPVDEVIVVDNGSVDATVEIAEKFAESMNVKISHCARQGSGAARNDGIEAAQGTLLAFLDADDIWMPEKIETQLRSYTGDSYFSGTYMYYLTPEGRLLGSNARYRNSKQADAALKSAAAVPAPMSSIVVTKDLILQAGNFNEQFRRAQDFEWMVRVSKYATLQIAQQQPLVGYTMGASSSTADSYIEQALAGEAVRRALHKDIAPNYELDVLRRLEVGDVPRRHRAGAHYRRAGIAVGERQYLTVFKELLLSTAIDPVSTVRKVAWQQNRKTDLTLPSAARNLFVAIHHDA